MTQPDHDIKIAEQIAATRAELDAAREVVRTLANDLADVADVIEPVLEEHIQRVRRARMGSVDELRQISSAIRDLRDLLTHADTRLMLDEAEEKGATVIYVPTEANLPVLEAGRLIGVKK